MTTLNKTIKQKLAFDLTVVAVDKKLKALNSKFKKLNTEFWIEYKSQIDSILQIDPSRYDSLIQLGAMRYTSSFEIKGIANSDRRFSDEFKTISRKLLAPHIGSASRYYNRFSVQFRSEQSVPMVNDDVLDINAKFAKRADTLLGEYIEIVIAANKFLDDVESVLAPIRTRKVLLERFPEASKLLDPIVKPAGNIIPVELINGVRERLKSGIPR